MFPIPFLLTAQIITARATGNLHLRHHEEVVIGGMNTTESDFMLGIGFKNLLYNF